MAWHYNKKILDTFVHHVTQYVWANIDGLGWRRIKPGSPDGVTNMAIAFAAAVANDRTVHAYIDGDNLITTMYLL